MDALFEQRIAQNEVLCAEALWHAVYEAFETADRTRGVEVPLAFIVLPLVLHRRSAESLAGKTQPGALYKALSADREITVDLQSRMQSMWRKTQRAMTLGLATDLFSIDTKSRYELIPNRKTAPVQHSLPEVKLVLGAAKRVGQALGEMNAVQLMTHLKVKF